jgi:branched-chain amino acid transport system substrate-binding protein
MQGAGLALAAPLLAGWAPRAALSAPGQAASKVVRLGALLPGSRVYPRLAENLMAGLLLGAEREGGTLDLVRADLGAAPGAALSAARRLIEQDKVDGLLGVVHAEIADRLAPLLAETRTPLWVCEVGASAARAVSPWITHHTLHFWQAQWLLGEWVARNVGRRVAIATALYDSGYDALYAFRLGVEAAGGQVALTQVTHLDPRDNGLPAALAEVRAARPDCVYALYSGPAAGEFMAAYAQAGLAGSVPLAGSGLMVEDDLLAAYGEAALGLVSCLPWVAAAGEPATAGLGRDYLARTGRPADALAALGYDAGRLIARAGGRGAEALTRVSMVTAHGPLTVDAATRQTRTPLYVRQVRRVEGALRNVAIAELALPADLDARLAAARSGPISGWLNTYLGV